MSTVRQHWDCITLKMRTPQNYVKNADTTEAYFNKSHLLRRVRFNYLFESFWQCPKAPSYGLTDRLLEDFRITNIIFETYVTN